MEAKRKCDKCGSTKFELHSFVNRVGELPFLDFMYFCSECGEMHEEYRKYHYIESANIFTGEVILKNKNQS